MSMAFESAELAIEPLAEFSCGQTDLGRSAARDCHALRQEVHSATALGGVGAKSVVSAARARGPDVPGRAFGSGSGAGFSGGRGDATERARLETPSAEPAHSWRGRLGARLLLDAPKPPPRLSQAVWSVINWAEAAKNYAAAKK